MNLYQAGYFRRGKQGSSAGWGIVSPSKGMSQIAKDGFKGIAAKLVELKSVGGIPVVNSGIFLHDRFVYLMQVNYAAKGDDARGVTFVHGYCFNTADYFELCSRPEMICGAAQENFLMEYDSSVTSYPVADKLAFENYDLRGLLSKYRMNDEEYRKLVLGAINAVENYSDPLCIKMNLRPDEYMQASKELLYLIMMGLPYHLRIKISFFSYSGAGAAVYVSDHTEGNNYVDLDSRNFSIDSTRLASFYFTRIYNSVKAEEYQKRDAFFKNIADFMNATLENPLRDIGCAQVEAGFQAKVKKNDGEGILPKTAVELLSAFLKNSLTENEEVYEYLAELLKVINDHSLSIADEKNRNRIINRYEKTERENYRKEVCRLIARETLEQDQKKGFESLNCLWSSSHKKFTTVLSEIKERNADYYTEYYLESYLPYVLTSLDELDEYLTEHKNAEEDEYKALLSILLKLMKKEMHGSDEYDQLRKILNHVQKILGNFPRELEKQIDRVWDCTHVSFWKNFPISSFQTEDIGEYKKLKVETIARDGWNGEKCDNAEKIVRLIELFEEREEERVWENLYDILFGDGVFTSKADKKYIQELFFNQKYDSLNLEEAAGFDCMLAMYYDFRNEKFETLKWGRVLAKECQSAFEPVYISQIMEHSLILKDEDLKEILLNSLLTDIKAAKKGNGVYSSKKVLGGLKRYCDCICGKEIRGENENEERQCYANALHRLFLGALPLFTITILLKEMSAYESMKNISIALYAGLFALLFLAVMGIKMSMAEGIDGLMDSYGITSQPRFVTYIVLAALLLAGIAVIFFTTSWKIMLAGIFLYSVLAVASAIVYSIFADD